MWNHGKKKRFGLLTLLQNCLTVAQGALSNANLYKQGSSNKSKILRRKQKRPSAKIDYTMVYGYIKTLQYSCSDNKIEGTTLHNKRFKSQS